MDLFDIDARAPGNPTKDQMRLMMQSLLADRFKLKAHFETREGPVFALTLVRPGQTGPKLRPHADGPACPDSFEFPASNSLPNVTDAFPSVCGWTQIGTTPDGKQLVGSRNMTMGAIAEEAIHNFGSLAGEIDKPVVDQSVPDLQNELSINTQERANASQVSDKLNEIHHRKAGENLEVVDPPPNRLLIAITLDLRRPRTPVLQPA